MGVVDWRAWTAQNGGTLPTAPNPPGTPAIPNSIFPGIGPIPDLINPATSFPPYPGLASPGNFVTINAIDPFYVGTYPTGAGWVAKMGDYWYTGVGVTQATWPAGSPGATVPAGPIMRPAIPGLTS
jgi:hypothetical protein